MAEYNQYRNQQRAVCKGITAKGTRLLMELREKKKQSQASE
jgi:hypothetical protein